jgi:putative transposase
MYPVPFSALLATPHTEAELDALRRSVARGTPYGSSAWVQQTATELGLESSLNRSGRPRKRAKADEPNGLFGEKQP